MTDPSKVHYLLVINRSGSMADIRHDMQSGLQAFIDRQLEDVDPAKRTVSLHEFDTLHSLVYDYEPLENAKGYKLNPRGGTALLDACGFAIKQLGVKLKHMPESERPGYVMVLIVTDGEENSSKEYSRSDIKEMIQHQTDTYNWKFSYLGANQDAFAEAGSIGIIGRAFSPGLVPAGAWAVLSRRQVMRSAWEPSPRTPSSLTISSSGTRQ